MAFKDIKAGDKVKYRAYAGMGLKGPEYKIKIAKVNPLLIFAHHVVVNAGDIPQVVNEQNFVEVIKK